MDSILKQEISNSLLQSTKLKESSITEYLNTFKTWINYFDINSILHIPTEDDYKNYAQYLFNNYNYTYKTFEKTLYIVVSIFKYYSIYKNIKEYNIEKINYLVSILLKAYYNSDKVDKNKVLSYACNTYSKEEIQSISSINNIRKILGNNIKSTRFYIFISLLKYTGLRRSDILNLKINNITIKNNNLKLTTTIKKTEKQYTTIIKDRNLIYILLKFIHQLSLSNDDYLLPAITKYNKIKKNTISSIMSLYKMYYKLLSYLNINSSRLTFVSFRKTLAQKLYNAKNSISNISNIFKWNSIACSSYITHNYT